MAAFPRKRPVLSALFLLLLICFGGSGTVAVDLPEPVFSGIPPILPQVSPEIAFTSTFRSGQLTYAHSVAFAESMQAVASGCSRYSPGTIPAYWKPIAREWMIHMTDRECGKHVRSATGIPTAPGEPAPRMAIGMLFPRRSPVRDGNDRVSSLLFLSSLEFRERQGNADLRPIQPSQVRMAVSEFQGFVLKRREEADALEGRLHEIAARIISAERMGAPERFPRELALARAELRYARHASTDGTFDLKEAETTILRANEAADRLLGWLNDRSS